MDVFRSRGRRLYGLAAYRLVSSLAITSRQADGKVQFGLYSVGRRMVRMSGIICFVVTGLLTWCILSVIVGLVLGHALSVLAARDEDAPSRRQGRAL